MTGARARALEDDIAEVVPEGIGPPAHVPADIFEVALTQMAEGQRLEATAIAAQLGISRMTVWRKAGNRDALLGEVLSFMARQLFAASIRDAGDLTGVDRVLAVARSFIERIHAREDFRAFLGHESERALALLTTPRTSLQASVVGMFDRLLAVEEERGALRSTMPRNDLAYAITRIGESFLYADLIADVQPDIDRAVQIVERVLEPERPG